MSVSHRAPDRALVRAGRLRVVRVAVAAAVGLVLFGGAAYGGTRMFAVGSGPDRPAAVDSAAEPLAEPDGSAPTEAASASPSAPATSSPAAPATPSPTRAKATATEKRTQPAPPAGPVNEVLRIVNNERAKAGCPALMIDSRLAKAANSHSADMAANNYFSHTGRNGSDVADRVEAAGYNWSAVGENIAKGQPTPAAVMKDWMASSGHRANILNCRFRNIGIGVVNAGNSPVWTQDFGTPAR
jgi:uncharacterized protein YkwD